MKCSDNQCWNEYNFTFPNKQVKAMAVFVPQFDWLIDSNVLDCKDNGSFLRSAIFSVRKVILNEFQQLALISVHNVNLDYQKRKLLYSMLNWVSTKGETLCPVSYCVFGNLKAIASLLLWGTFWDCLIGYRIRQNVKLFQGQAHVLKLWPSLFGGFYFVRGAKYFWDINIMLCPRPTFD